MGVKTVLSSIFFLPGTDSFSKNGTDYPTKFRVTLYDSLKRTVMIMNRTIMKRTFGAWMATIFSSSMNGATAFALKFAAENVHTPVGKDGEGAYTAATKGCFDVIDMATPLVLQEISEQHINPDRAFHVADYGTADAGTSLGLLTKVVRSVRKRTSGDDKKEVVIHYEDQLNNEWKSVFNHALGNIKVTDAYNNEIDTPFNLGGVFVEANGVGFHQQCYASGSIDLGVSFTAMHWLSSSPSSLKGSKYMHAARCLDGPPEAEKLQAESDWYKILTARSRELSPGGRFICVNFCVSKEGYFLGQTDVGSSMWDSFAYAWNKLAQDGIINEDEQLGVSFPNYYRTTEEFLAGIERCPDLKLVSAEEKIVRCPYREQYIDSDSKMSAEDYAKTFVPTTRTWSHSTFKTALSDKRSDEEKEKILEQFWSNYEELVAQSPETHGMDYVHSYLVIEKV
ncbi:unnamed protein product [Pseudo-nitzschia multistriata]|uniref:Methyltransferase type 11 domain-containing protein n=1 Tax=Pseudo-nitzschia multistriata TaxID=183589 RepID=A0A448Z9G6_9STRA|nr:unnamed protein product [Pseudo-nitzschia multistriata]